MAGTFVISETSEWLPAGWVFDNAMEELAKFVEQDNPDLAQELLDARTSVSMGYFDLRTKDSLSIMLLAKAAKRAVEAVRGRGPDTFEQPEFFSGYVAQLDKLCSLLTKDPRSVESAWIKP